MWFIGRHHAAPFATHPEPWHSSHRALGVRPKFEHPHSVIGTAQERQSRTPPSITPGLCHPHSTAAAGATEFPWRTQSEASA